MRIVRILLFCLALAALLVSTVFVPQVQTWIVQARLGRPGPIQGSVESVEASPGSVEFEDMKLSLGGATLTIPLLDANLPVVRAIWKRRIEVKTLVAKGWTLDLRPKGPDGKPARGQAGGPTPIREAEGFLAALLSRWALDSDLSLDGVDLEGDIIAVTTLHGLPLRTHITIKGGGLASGHAGSFDIETKYAVLDRNNSVATYTLHGQLLLGMDTPRTFNRVEFKGSLSTRGGLNYDGDLVAGRAAGGETCAIEIANGGSRLASIDALYGKASRRLSGTWKLDLRDLDIAPLVTGRTLPGFVAAGEGRFDADPAFDDVRASGKAVGTITRIGTLMPELDKLGEVRVDGAFEGEKTGGSIRIDSLDATAAGSGLSATIRLNQPLDFADPKPDLDVGFRDLPLEWLAAYTQPFAFTGGGASGEFAVRPAPGGFSAAPKTPLKAAGVTATWGRTVLGKNLDLSASLSVEQTGNGLKVRAAPASVIAAGRPLATADIDITKPLGDDQPVSIKGTWKAEIQGRHASGDFSSSPGNMAGADFNLKVAGLDPAHLLTASVHLDPDNGGAIAFTGPVKIVRGAETSDFSAVGTVTPGAEPRLDVKVEGRSLVLDTLGPALAAAPGLSKGRDSRPFWGDVSGTATLALDRLVARGRTFNQASGTVEFDHGSIKLGNGKATVGLGKAARVALLDGTIEFSAVPPHPYELKGKVSIGDVSSESVFGEASLDMSRDSLPRVEGRFAISGDIAGNGDNLDDLVHRIHPRLTLTSNDGIFRALATGVAGAIPEVETPMADTVGAVGSVVGAILGGRRDMGSSGRNPVSKGDQGIIDFLDSVSELGCDTFSLKLSENDDRSIALSDVTMEARDVRITGSARIGAAQGAAFRDRPLSADLQLWARGRVAGNLTAAGLLSETKDAKGYALMTIPVRLGGSLAHIDNTEWHNALYKAAADLSKGAKKP